MTLYFEISLSNKRHIVPEIEDVNNRKRTCQPKVVPNQEVQEIIDFPVIDLELKTEIEAPSVAGLDVETEMSLGENMSRYEKPVFLLRNKSCHLTYR